MTASTSTYVFDREWTMERDRLRALESLFDDASMRHLARVGLTEGWAMPGGRVRGWGDRAPPRGTRR